MQNSVKSYTLAACLHCLYLTQTHSILAKRCVNSTTLTFLSDSYPATHPATIMQLSRDLLTLQRLKSFAAVWGKKITPALTFYLHYQGLHKAVQHNIKAPEKKGK